MSVNPYELADELTGAPMPPLHGRRKRIAGWAIAALAMLAGAVPVEEAAAQAYPSQSVRIIVPYAAGGLTDAATRILAAKLQENIGQPVLVENKPGASAIIGSDVVAKATPDGHTLLMTSISHTVLTSFFDKLPFDPVKDFIPIALVASAPSVLVTGPDSPFKTVAEVVAYGRANPDKLSFASAGNATLGHLLGEWFKREAKIEILHVPNKGGGPALIEVMAGRIPLFFDTLTTTSTNAKAGKIRPLAVTSERRNALLAETPTMIESGFAGFVGTSWIGLLAPARTPNEVIAKINAEVGKALAAAEVKDRLAPLGTEPEGGPPARFAAFLEGEGKRWATLIKEANIKAE